MSKKEYKMNKSVLVSFLLIASVLFLATTVSAVEIADNAMIKVNDVEVSTLVSSTGDYVSVVAGETIEVKVTFEVGSLDLGNGETSASNVKIRADIEGDKSDVTAVTASFDVEEWRTYTKTLTLKVPYELKDELSEDLTLNLKIWNADYKTEVPAITLGVQRPSYDADIKSITVSNSVEAGKLFPVDIVLKNVGYNDLDDVYVTVKMPELNIEKTAYFGDLVAVETDDDENTATGRLYLEVPFDVKSGTYTLEVSVKNDETEKTVSKQISVENGFPEVAMKVGNDLLLLNPTDTLRVYKVVYQANEAIVVVPAGLSKTVPIELGATDSQVDVFVFSGDELLSTLKFSGSAVSGETEVASPIIVLTVILAIVFLVLLVVLIVLMTKKPQKTEEFGESYY
ncbi:MAG: hypothetical protein NTU63_03820 [Candidatus Pacearchaeota archaeon]|nr:hypothetical protein [Candidatus Pacearchaeota archaeon]